MLKVRSAKSSVVINIGFVSPFFEWQGVSARFFEMIHNALSTKIVINACDFTAMGENSLGDVVAKYNIFGGPSFVALSAEKLSMEFPNVLSGEYDLAMQIIGPVESSFPNTFPECQYATIQSIFYEHVEVVDGGVAADYLSRYAIPSADKVFGEIGAVHAPNGRFAVVGSDATWRALCSVERSESLENALFLNFDLTLFKVNTSDSFDNKLNRVNAIATACAAALDLEWDRAE